MMKKIAYFSILTSMIAAGVISINLGIFQLSIFRVSIIFMAVTMVVKVLLKNIKIKVINKNENSYSINFMMIWLVYAILTLGWVKDYGDWFRAIYFLSLGVICVVIYSRVFKTTDDILIAFRIMAIMTLLHVLIGMYEIHTGNYMFLSAEIVATYLRKNYPVSMFGNTNDFATFLLMSIFIVYICLISSKRIIGKILYAGIMISSIYLLIMTGSRACILGLILAGALFVFLSIKNKKGRRTLLIILISLFGLILLVPEVLSSFFLMIDQNLYFRFSADTGSDSTRIKLIKDGLYFLVNTFGFGTGAGNIEYWMDNYGVYYTGSITNIHNWWMEILTGYGVIIFILYAIFYFKLFRSLYRRYKITRDKKVMTISLGIMCCMAGFVVGSISSSSNISAEWLWVFWAICIAFQGINYSTKNKGYSS